MEELKDNKQTLLEAVRNKEQQEVASGAMTMDAFVQKLIELLHHYSDLKKEDYKGWISEEAYRIFEDGLRDPEELALWKRIEAAPENIPGEIQAKMQLLITYIERYPQGPKIDEAKSMLGRLKGVSVSVEDEEDWRRMFANSHEPGYDELRNHKQRFFPYCKHKNALDDKMWTIIDLKRVGVETQGLLKRYYDDWVNDGGMHVEYAKRQLDAFHKWDDGNNPDWKDIFKLKHFKDEYTDFVLINDVNAKYEGKRRAVLADMKSHTENYEKSKLDSYINAGIFTRTELEEEGILPPPLGGDPEKLPKLEQFSANPNYEAIEGNTDVYLFGVPGTGKTCLLMGLSGAVNTMFTINTRVKGGPYSSALRQYVDAGITPEGTPERFVTTINGVISERCEGKKTQEDQFQNHCINFVEMSGEEFAYKIANKEGAKLEDMGEGTTALLRNRNRKVFFIIIDPTVDVIKFTHYEDIIEEGQRVGVKGETKYVNQVDCIDKFVSLFEMKENQKFMKRVDAVHFIVTKADTLGNDDEIRKREARKLMIDKYGNAVGQLIRYCRKNKRVNYATDYHPYVYPFSLGRFYAGGTFKYNNSSSLKIINVLRFNTAAKKEDTFIDKVRDFLA